ncbi:sulfotransferase family 2 domain-containing protein [Cohnella boryungensis]|uniref:Sulfotransferase family 2 domain-containing protein n=1 Tax=Cohnella boryungensis TaxID=768479 RepID=A0ABV8S6V0_9BACL
MSSDSNARSRLLFFMHIPKTAGSSIHQILYRQYDGRLGVVAGQGPDEWDELLSVPDHGLDCVFGHYGYGLHRCSVRPHEYTTMVRDPIEAMLSYYFYIAAQPSHWLYPYAAELTMTQFFDMPNEILDLFFRDYQSAFIVGRRPASAQEAIRALQAHFPLVGITELYHESVYLMKRRYGWGAVEVFHVNATPNRPTREQIDPEALDRIKRLIGIDIRLYRFARTRLIQELRQLPRAEKRIIEQFKAVGRLDD